MRTIWSLLLVIGVSGAVLAGATVAFFSDKEQSNGNTFTAGAIDLQVDNTSYYNGVANPNTSWEQADLTIQKFFDFLDLKPDDYGEDTISLHVATNEAYLCANVTLTSNDDNGINEPESEVDTTDGAGAGELAGLVNFLWWADDGDNVLENDEQVINTGNFGALSVGQTYSLALADSDDNIWTGTGGPVAPNQTLYIGKAWCFGQIATAALPQSNYTGPAADNNGDSTLGTPEDGGISCDGTSLGNESQTDSLTADIAFTAEQARHNEDFQCAPNGPRTTLTLVKQLFSPNDEATDWTLSASGPTVLSGVTGSTEVTNVVVTPGEYNLSEAGPATYTASNWSCVGGTQNDDNTVTLAEGDNVTCTIVNYVSCTDPAMRYADSVISSDQGVLKNGGAVLANRSNPSSALNAPESSGTPYDVAIPGTFFSLGFDEGTDSTPSEGGNIVIEFTNNFLIDGPGNDLKTYEITGGSNYPVEKVKIEVSQDNTNWFTVTSSNDRDAEADLALSGLAWARYVRLTDVSVRSQYEPTADGYDLDAFEALTCADRPL